MFLSQIRYAVSYCYCNLPPLYMLLRQDTINTIYDFRQRVDGRVISHFIFFCWHYFHSTLWNDSFEVSVIKICSQEHYWLRNALPPEELVPVFQKSYFFNLPPEGKHNCLFLPGLWQSIQSHTQKEHLPAFISLLDRGTGWVQWPLLLYEVQTLWAVCNQASSTRHQAIIPDLWP